MMRAPLEEREYEVWADDTYPPYVLLLLREESALPTYKIINPAKNNKVEFVSDNYQEVTYWLLEDEYSRVEGRTKILEVWEQSMITAEELSSVPSRGADGSEYKHELISGKLIRLPLNSAVHGIICADLMATIYKHVESRDLGIVFGTGTGFLIERTPDTVLGVDVAYVSNERLATISNLDEFIPFAPDLAIEVLGVNDVISELGDRLQRYFNAGARAVWVFDLTSRTATIHDSQGSAQTVSETDTFNGGDVLPELYVDLARLYSSI